MIMIAVVALLVCGGGAAGAYFYFFQPAEASAGDAADEVGKAHEQAKGGHGKVAGSSFVELDPLILPIVDNNGVNQVVSLVVALEVADEETMKAVEAMTPKLKDAYIQDMYGMLNGYASMKGGVVQVAMIKKRLNKISNDVLGENVVHDVLLQVVQQRPI
jgi:flagellar FliL protein